jgi:hypothetical protein
MDLEHARRNEKATLDALMAALQTIPHADASLVDEEHRLSPRHTLDAKIDFALADRHITLLIEVKKAVFPRDIPQILYQLRSIRNAFVHSPQENVVPLLAAESISTGAREMLREENIGFFDTGGSLFLPAKGAYLYVDRPVPKTLEKSVRSLFTGKRSQVLHALLINRQDWVGVHALADLARVSAGTASETLTALERMDWVSSQGQGPSKERRLTNPSGLLDEWRTQVLTARRPLTRRRYYVPGGDLTAMAHHLAELCDQQNVEYVLTQDFAAQQYAPFLSGISRIACRMVPGIGAGKVIAGLDARAVTEGANLDIIETTSGGEFLFKNQRRDLWVASPVQTYLDLLRSEGRSRNMAEHLRKEVLGI